MTGFAAAQGAGQGWSWSVEMRSVNGRGLDLRFRLPDWIEGLEPELRKTMQARLNRGSVNVGIRLQRDEAGAGVSLNTAALHNALVLLKEIEVQAQDQGLRIKKVSAGDIAAIKGVLDLSETSSTDGAALKPLVLATAATCIDGFVADRDREGDAIAAVLSGQIDRMGRLIDDARAAAGDREAQARAAIQRAVARLLDVGDMPDEARLTQELALIAVKNDVTEEIDRLDTHIAAARNLMGESGAIGRKFDFLMQEFNREANTLCSKSASADLTRVGLDLKVIIDQMREQVQNVE
ncbi:MAG: YicC family protein [Silicimonas sp.]|nr:YicC family protein [Silicimonas sp.]